MDDQLLVFRHIQWDRIHWADMNEDKENNKVDAEMVQECTIWRLSLLPSNGITSVCE